MESITLPNQTLYVKNLPEKVTKELMKTTLNTIFTAHGTVSAVVIIRSKALRGQAWVTMSSIPEATTCLKELEGMEICQKPMNISYAKEKSDKVAKREGTYQPAALKEQREMKKKAREEAEAVKSSNKRIKFDEAEAPVPVEPEAEADAGPAPPSRILLAPNLPIECTAQMLAILFSQYAGFIDARCPKPSVGLVEFTSEREATIAMDALKGFKLTPTVCLELGYGKE